MADEGGQTNGIKSLDAALRVLASLSGQNGPVPLSDIARACKMPPSKVHRYLASFLRAGLVKQEGPSGRYDLGLEAMQLGLAAIARHDFVNHTADGLAELAAETEMTVLLSVWGNGGATVVRWERGISPTVTSMGLGTTLPLLNSATGRAFLAWAPPPQIAKLRDAELRRAARNPDLLYDFKATTAGIDALIASIRARGYASVDGKFIPGLVAAAAPILDWQQEAQAVVTLVGTDPQEITQRTNSIQRLLAFCAEHSVIRKSP
ncbi:IclR family transcriptional regulator [Nitratireductor pacificus]|uniref:Transcriptional repressor protein n=1 Tax=Nitratireductor pacificus pht-3B TaxID=391937 RepID=K2NA73_9HYPH|nr:IclR family transcriptional regulator [Nitratireductor pacificus]EKF21013.1 transcriptional repressor protein [Nitratireductor pacificus pht-3B]